MKDKKEKIYDILLELIEDYHIPEGKSTEIACDKLNSLFLQYRQELKKWLLANNCCPLSDDVVIEKKKVINLLEERKE